jgi:hypothetical protein
MEVPAPRQAFDECTPLTLQRIDSRTTYEKLELEHDCENPRGAWRWILTYSR